jgi:hypothetical protein
VNATEPVSAIIEEFMTKIAGILFLAALSTPLGAQMPGNSCCELSAKVDVAPGDDSHVILNLVVKNIATDLVLVVWGGSDDILFAVLKANGQEAERTEEGQRMLTREMSGSMRSAGLGRGESFEQAFDLAQVYTLRPGAYVVVVIRKVVVKDVQIPFSTKASFTIP